MKNAQLPPPHLHHGNGHCLAGGGEMSGQGRDLRDQRDERDNSLDSHSGPTWRREARRVTNQELSHRCPPPPTLSTFFFLLLLFSFLLLPFFAANAATVNVSVPGGVGQVSVNGGSKSSSVGISVEAGTELEIVYYAGSDTSKSFYQWTGLPITVYPFNTNLTVTVAGDLDIVVKIADVKYVATDGDDTDGDGTRANPYATIQKAYSVVPNFGEIRVKGGLYSANGVIKHYDSDDTFYYASNVVFRGSYNDNWVQDYRNSRTILKSTSTSTDVIHLETVQTNRFDGFDVTGGRYGIFGGGENFNGTTRKSLGIYTHFFVTHCIVTNNNSHGLYHNVNWSGDPDYGFAVASSLIAKNKSYGYYVKNDQDTATANYFFNCTIADNSSRGYDGYGSFQNYFYNTIIANNGTYDLYPETSGCAIQLAYLCAYGGKTAVQGGNSSAYVLSSEYLEVDPKFTGFYELGEKSRCNKSGCDLSAHNILPVDTDLYGTPWNGEYDRGCIKSAYPKIEIKTFDEVYVAGDGDDDNDGDDPTRAVQTIAAGLMHLNSGGTLHLGEGTFTSTVTLSGDGTKVIGAGRDRTFIKGKLSAGVSVNAHSAVVQDLAIDGPAYGVQLQQIDGLNPTNVVIRNCCIRNCTTTGIYCSQDNVNGVAYTNFISHCIISNCTSYGIHGVGNHSGAKRYGSFLVDNTLFAYNGTAFYSMFQPPNSGYTGYNECRFVNCTAVSNKTAGLTVYTGLRMILDNCIATGNGSKNLGSSGGAITLNNSIVNGYITSSGSIVVNEGAYDGLDPLIDGAFKPTQKSAANKTGANVSDRSTLYATDLDGAAWNGEYDMGCYKSAYPKYTRATYDVIYVAADGDDDNEGNTAEAPLLTLGAAKMRVNNGGVMHIGEGTFAENFALDGAGMKVLGAGMGRTVIAPVSGIALTVNSHAAEIADLTIVGKTYGIKFQPLDGYNLTNVLIRSCEIRDCSTAGIYFGYQDNLNAVNYTNRISHCIISNCTSYALHGNGVHSGSARKGTLLVDNSLIVRNGQAFYSDWQPPQNSKNVFKFYNTTVANNTTGLQTGTNLILQFFNCILADNGPANAVKNVFSDATSGECQAWNSYIGGTTEYNGNIVTITPTLTNTLTNRLDALGYQEAAAWHLKRRSPLSRLGCRKYGADLYSHDLDGAPYRERVRVTPGCYLAPDDGLCILVR